MRPRALDKPPARVLSPLAFQPAGQLASLTSSPSVRCSASPSPWPRLVSMTSARPELQPCVFNAILNANCHARQHRRLSSVGNVTKRPGGASDLKICYDKWQTGIDTHTHTHAHTQYATLLQFTCHKIAKLPQSLATCRANLRERERQEEVEKEGRRGRGRGDRDCQCHLCPNFAKVCISLCHKHK